MRAWPLGQEVAQRYLQFNVDVLGGKYSHFQRKSAPRKGQKFPELQVGRQMARVSAPSSPTGSLCGHEQAGLSVPICNMIGFDSMKSKGLSCSQADMLPDTMQLVSVWLLGSISLARILSTLSSEYLSISSPPLLLPFSSLCFFSFFWPIRLLVFPFSLNED